jgi:unsaturated rhamnogalacturonyl hydrolase
MKFERYVTSYLTDYQNAKKDWNYEDGCVLMGAVMLYQATKNECYKDFVVNYMKNYINEDGSINHYDKEQYNIDSINTGKILFFLYNETKDEKYKIAIEILMDQLRTQPRTKSSNFWHKKIYPNQIWLDGLYMAQPFYMAYETQFNQKKNYKDIMEQFENVRKYLYNEDKKLYYHGYDEARVQPWADKVTGLSSNFWLRAIGWYLMALIDTMDEMSEEIFEQYKLLEHLFKEGIKGILQYQDKESKLFYQVIDKVDINNNYLETSGSAMVAYAIIKGCRLGALLKDKYQQIGEDIINSLIHNKLIEKNGILTLTDICSVAGLGPGNTRDGSTEYYLSEPIVSDESKGVGAFMMAYAQLLLLLEEEGERKEEHVYE